MFFLGSKPCVVHGARTAYECIEWWSCTVITATDHERRDRFRRRSVYSECDRTFGVGVGLATTVRGDCESNTGSAPRASPTPPTTASPPQSVELIRFAAR